MRYKAIFFDLDGTLIDPKLGITTGIQYALARFGIEEDREMLTPFIGPPANISFQKFYGFDEKKAMEAVGYYREYYIPKGMYESTVYRGMPELLAKLKAAKAKLYIVTSKPTFLAERLAKYHELNDYFENIIGCLPDLSNADKTTLIKDALTLTHEKKESVVMVGDRDYDIKGAQANSIDSIGVTFGYGLHDEIDNAKPTFVANSVKELEKYLLVDK